MPTANVCERVVGAYNLDQKTGHKEIVVVNSNCPKVGKGLLGQDLVKDHVSNVTILERDPKTGRYDKKKVVYTLPGKEKFSDTFMAYNPLRGNTIELDEKAVTVTDMNNDGKLDLVINTSSKDGLKHCSSSKITVLYNHGNLEFKPQNPKKPE